MYRALCLSTCVIGQPFTPVMPGMCYPESVALLVMPDIRHREPPPPSVMPDMVHRASIWGAVLMDPRQRPAGMTKGRKGFLPLPTTAGAGSPTCEDNGKRLSYLTFVIENLSPLRHARHSSSGTSSPSVMPDMVHRASIW